MNNTVGMSKEDIQMLIELADTWVQEWVVIRADPPPDRRKGSVSFYAYSDEPKFIGHHFGWDGDDATRLTDGSFDIDPLTFRIDNPSKQGVGDD